MMLEKSLVMHMDKWCKGGIGKEDGDISFEGVPYQLSTVARTTLQRTALSATISLSIQYAIFTIFSDQGANTDRSLLLEEPTEEVCGTI